MCITGTYKLEQSVLSASYPGLPVTMCCGALGQQGYTYRHDTVLTSELQAVVVDVRVYADVDGKHVSDAPPATMPPSTLVSSNIFVCNKEF